MNDSKVYNSSTRPFNSYVLSAKDERFKATINTLFSVQADYSNVDLTFLPEAFEPQISVWKDFLVPSMDQGRCGSCWSFASVGMLSDRFNVLSRTAFFKKSLSQIINILCNDFTEILFADNDNLLNTLYNPFRSDTTILNEQACFGNSIVLSFLYLKYFGVSTYNCEPYNIQDLAHFKIKQTNFGLLPTRNFKESPTKFRTLDDKSNKIASCYFYNPFSGKPFSYCADVIVAKSQNIYTKPYQAFKVLFAYNIKDADKHIDYIKYDIYRFGPVCSSFFVYDDFYTFDPLKDGVYVHKETENDIPVGGHSIEIVGWGEFRNASGMLLPFWWVKNNWGINYGYDGYFRFLRGKDQCGIETNIISAIPLLPINSDWNKLKIMNQEIMDLGIFHINRQYLQNQFVFLSKIITYFYNREPVIPILQKCFDIYGFYFYEAFLYTSFWNNDFLINGFTLHNFLYLPGMDYSLDPRIKFNLHEMAGSISASPVTSQYANRIWRVIFLIILLLMIVIFIIIFIKLISLFVGGRTMKDTA